MRFWKSGLALGIGAITMMIAYQNCAQSQGTQQGRAESQQTDVEIDYPVYALNAETSGSEKVSAGSCEFENLQCLRKVYSPAVDDLQTDEILCLDEESAQHCLKVSTVYYNTSFALQHCEDCTADDAKQGGQYNREEVTCWVGAPAAGPGSVFALRSSFQEAAKVALVACAGGQ